MPTSRASQLSPAARLAEIALVALITCLTMRLGQVAGLLRDGDVSHVSPLWPATGINIAMVFLRGPRIWPGILLGSIVDNTLTFGAKFPAVPFLAPIADTAEPLIALYLYRLLRGGPQPLARTNDALRYIICCAYVAPAVAAGLGVALLWRVPGFFQPPIAWRSWLDWGLPSGVGVLVIAPAVLCWRGLHPLPWHNTRLLHAAGIAACLVALELWVFSAPPSGSTFDPHLLIFLVLPLVVWAALVFGARGGAICTLVTSLVAVIGAVRGLGPFANLPLPRALLILQVYLAAFALVSLLLSAVTEERGQAYRGMVRQAETIQLLFEELNHRVRNNLASLLSLIDLSRGAAGDVDRFASLISGRVQAMADIHSVLASERWVAMSIHDLVTSVAPGDTIDRVRLTGSPLNIPPQQAMPLGLVLHELITNSHKHGALRTSAGSAELTWTSDPSASKIKPGDGVLIRFHWREHLPTSPPVPAPASAVPANGAAIHPRPANHAPNLHHNGNNHHNHNGNNHRSGLALINGLIHSDLRGTIEFTFPPEGASHTFDIRIESPAAPVA